MNNRHLLFIDLEHVKSKFKTPVKGCSLLPGWTLLAMYSNDRKLKFPRLLS